MAVPETTSAEAFERYVGGKVLQACRGDAWRDIIACIIAPPRRVELVSLPAVSEPFLAWSVSGEVDFQEREGNRPWITHRIRKGAFFLTSGGAPYDCRWKAVGNEPFQSMAVFIALPLLQRALEEVFGADAAHPSHPLAGRIEAVSLTEFLSNPATGGARRQATAGRRCVNLLSAFN